jgi:hypothetical protein
MVEIRPAIFTPHIQKEDSMGTPELIATLEKGLREGRIAPYLADYIAAQELRVTADEVGYSEWGVSEDEGDQHADR